MNAISFSQPMVFEMSHQDLEAGGSTQSGAGCEPTDLARRRVVLSEDMSHRLLDPVTQVELVVPDGISDADAIKHARLRRAGQLRHLRLSPEWGTGCFLFSDGGGADPEHFNITPNMADRLRKWAAHWEELGNPFTECTDLDALDTWCQQGLTLAIALQRELYMTTVVVPEFGGLRSRGWEFSQP